MWNRGRERVTAVCQQAIQGIFRSGQPFLFPFLWSAVFSAPAALALYFVLTFGVNVPFWDGFGYTETISMSLPELFLSGEIYQQHNEHRTVIPRLVMWGVASATQHNTVALMLASQACLLGMLVLLCLQLQRQFDFRQAAWMLLPVPLLLYDLRQVENFLWGVQIIFTLTTLEVVASLLLLHYAATMPTAAWKYFAGGTLCAVAASFSHGSGMLVWPAGILAIALSHEPRRRIRMLVGWMAATGIVLWLYFLNFDAEERPGFYALYHLPEALDYLRVYLGGALGTTVHEAKWLGDLAVLLTAAVLALSLAAGRWRANGLWISLAGYVAISAVIATITRCALGEVQAFSSRYAGFTVLLWISLYLIACDLYLHSRSRLATCAYVGFTCLIVGLACRADMEGWHQGVAFHNYRRFAARLVLTADERSDAELGLLYVDAERLRRRIAILKRLRYSVFASQDAGHVERFPDRLQNREANVRYAIDQVHLDNAVVTISGWIIDRDAMQPGSSLWLRTKDENRPVVYGLYRPDVARHFRQRNFAMSGFQAAADISHLSPGKQSVQLRLVTADGSGYYAIDVEIDVPPPTKRMARR